jgi:hypothetical protein
MAFSRSENMGVTSTEVTKSKSVPRRGSDTPKRASFCRPPTTAWERGCAGLARLSGVPMSDVTRILNAVEQGDKWALRPFRLAQRIPTAIHLDRLRDSERLFLRQGFEAD